MPEPSYLRLKVHADAKQPKLTANPRIGLKWSYDSFRVGLKVGDPPTIIFSAMNINGERHSLDVIVEADVVGLQAAAPNPASKTIGIREVAFAPSP